MGYEEIVSKIVVPIFVTIVTWLFSTVLKLKNETTKLFSKNEQISEKLINKRYCNNDTHKEVVNQLTIMLNKTQMLEQEVNNNKQKSVKFETTIENMNSTITEIKKNNEKMNEKLDILILRLKVKK